ncbi:unnamed protein product [Dibothriocephalus latus]|uniref:WAP domain-containing protein n=1 Tax=Dibothriocephalus latus TaxID=60516 RepID=A0A3P7RDH8_DIBLA|nr:unnamed protein product [Dibothriocephalus latus]
MSPAHDLSYVFILPRLEEHADAFPNSPPELQRQTCLDACSFAREEYLETAAILAGSKQAVCPLPSSWPESCQQVCVTDADCHPPRVTRCCQSDVCARSNGGGGGGGVLRFAGSVSQTPPTGVCMQVVTTIKGTHNNDTNNQHHHHHHRHRHHHNYNHCYHYHVSVIIASCKKHYKKRTRHYRSDN